MLQEKLFFLKFFWAINTSHLLLTRALKDKHNQTLNKNPDKSHWFVIVIKPSLTSCEWLFHFKRFFFNAFWPVSASKNHMSNKEQTERYSDVQELYIEVL